MIGPSEPTRLPFLPPSDAPSEPEKCPKIDPSERPRNPILTKFPQPAAGAGYSLRSLAHGVGYSPAPAGSGACGGPCTLKSR